MVSPKHQNRWPIMTAHEQRELHTFSPSDRARVRKAHDRLKKVGRKYEAALGSSGKGYWRAHDSYRRAKGALERVFRHARLRAARHAGSR